MKVVRLTNQNIPIWSMLDGDHALKKHINKINPQLIKSPNIFDPLENKLRYDVFKREREWILDNLGENPSFGIVEFTYADLMDFITCFRSISFKKFVDEHIVSIDDRKHNFLIKRSEGDFEKPKPYVRYMERFKKKTCESSYNIKLNDIDDISKMNSKDLWLATNRGLLVKERDGKIKILDGTHRLTSYALSINDGDRIPKKLYAFYSEK